MPPRQGGAVAAGPRGWQSGKRESNPPRRAHETLLEPLQSIPQSGRQESNLPSTAYQAAASPLGLGPKKRPVRDSNPSRLPDRQVATRAASQGVKGGRKEWE